VGALRPPVASTSPSGTDDRTEYCGDCGRETRRDVNLEIRTGSDDPRTARFPRESSRVTTCARCGAETATRMNDV